eukprot:6310649-Prymnesium_polylepis.1
MLALLYIQRCHSLRERDTQHLTNSASYSAVISAVIWRAGLIIMLHDSHHVAPRQLLLLTTSTFPFSPPTSSPSHHQHLPLLTTSTFPCSPPAPATSHYSRLMLLPTTAASCCSPPHTAVHLGREHDRSNQVSSSVIEGLPHRDDAAREHHRLRARSARGMRDVCRWHEGWVARPCRRRALPPLNYDGFTQSLCNSTAS